MVLEDEAAVVAAASLGVTVIVDNAVTVVSTVAIPHVLPSVSLTGELQPELPEPEVAATPVALEPELGAAIAELVAAMAELGASATALPLSDEGAAEAAEDDGAEL